MAAIDRCMTFESNLLIFVSLFLITVITYHVRLETLRSSLFYYRYTQCSTYRIAQLLDNTLGWYSILISFSGHEVILD